VDDVVAWLLLAFALALIGKGGGSGSLGIRMAGLVGYLVLMLGVVRPLANLAVKRHKSTKLSLELFGLGGDPPASLCRSHGCAGDPSSLRSLPLRRLLPAHSRWQEEIRERSDMLIAVLLLPLFFALTGMRTRLDLLNDANMWLWAGIVAGRRRRSKMGGAILAARWMGQSWRNAGGTGRAAEHARAGGVESC